MKKSLIVGLSAMMAVVVLASFALGFSIGVFAVRSGNTSLTQTAIDVDQPNVSGDSASNESQSGAPAISKDDGIAPLGTTSTPEVTSETPKIEEEIIVNEKPLVKADKGFKVVGYYPSWDVGGREKIRYDVVTHINYAFAIPTADGTLRPLENPESATAIIKEAHKNNVKVLIAIGGWSYNDNPLEPVFKSATETAEKTKILVDEIMKMVDKYGFDGVDLDWEHPRFQDVTQTQYVNLLKALRVELDKRKLLLTSAVLSGVSADGVVMYDAAAHTDEVVKLVDWLNIMAYDGGDGDRHSSYEFAVNCGNYWGKTRNVPKEKYVLGVPFYGRPSWATYEDILAANPDAYKTDISTINGMEAHYNGVDTITKKTKWAIENAGGIMIWELSQDCLDDNKSLLNAIGKAVK